MTEILTPDCPVCSQPPYCPCGEEAIRHTDPRLSGQAVLDLVAKITGIQFCGATGA